VRKRHFENRAIWFTPLTALLAASALAAPPLKSVDLDAPGEDTAEAPPEADTNPPEAEQAPSEQAPSETAPMTPGKAAPVPKPPPPTAEPRPTVPPGQDYTVKTGDTLWDISGSYLQSPWFWPKLWSYNPQIANPHWIYPGNEIHFYPGGGAQVGAEASGGPPAPPEEEEADVQVLGRIGYVPPGTMLVPTEGFVTRRELLESGEIVGSPAEKQLLSAHDAVYMTFDHAKPRPGDELVVFRTVKAVYHPQSGDLLGYLTLLRGTVRVTASGRPMITAQIDKNFNTIERGDKVGPWGEKYLRNVALKGNDRALAGFVIATYTPEILNIGEGHFVFVDRGRRDGVQEGNTFNVLEKRDGLEEDYTARWMPGFPVETIGKLLIVDTKETASEALVINSVRELQVGDRIEMLPQETSNR
jgi:hypothetical protein